MIFRRLTWATSRFKIDGEYLSYLRIADGILICANTPHELQQMLNELNYEMYYRYDLFIRKVITFLF